MTAHDAFPILNLIALVAWVLLALSPRLPRVTTTISGVAVPVLLAAVYAVIVATFWSTAEGGFSSLADVATLFTSPWALLAGWVHYLAFDLLVGHWEMRDARARGVPYLVVLPCLALTFLFGPAGWLLYLVARTVTTHSTQPA